MDATWGLLGPELLPNARRTRTLGLRASVRSFNNLAVPGLGGVWYGKQLLLATLGVAVAENARNRGAKITNIETANAIEALACWMAFNGNDWSSDARLLGKTKLRGKDVPRFQTARQRSFYVTQPMRTASVQALPALGLVESDRSRFNAFSCSSEGRSFIESATHDSRPFKRTVLDHLTRWVMTVEKAAVRRETRVDTESLRQALSPLEPLPIGAVPMLRERLLQGGSEPDEDKTRRSNALAWVEELRNNRPDELTWARRPQEISVGHWHDLQAGALFFAVRVAAISTLDKAEEHMGNKSDGQFLSLRLQLPDTFGAALDELASAAKRFLDFTHNGKEANAFCQECMNDTQGDVLRNLAERDGQVLRVVADKIKPGPAFRGSSASDRQDDVGNDGQREPQSASIPLPENISERMRNLYLLNLDMHAELGAYLNSDTGTDRE